MKRGVVYYATMGLLAGLAYLTLAWQVGVIVGMMLP